MAQRYLIALGSNMRHHRYGSPERVLLAALAALPGAGIKVLSASPIMASAPLGPSRRCYANAAALIEIGLMPDELLSVLQAIEKDFGRRRGGQRWGSRVLDLDLVLWQGGAWCGPGLTIPHPAFRERRFVLQPACMVASGWRDPLSGLTLRQLRLRLTHPRPIPT